jgi:predicted acyltransferase
LFAIGLLLNGFPHYDLSSLRIPGVLQRIAVCYLIAAALNIYFRVRIQAAAAVAFCAVYWLLMAFAPAPGCGPGSLEKGCNFAQYVDSLLLSGHMWSQTKTWDPEGIVSTLPAISTVLAGALAASLLRRPISGAGIGCWLFTGGNALIVLGLFLSQWMPINKGIWTVPFAVLMAGISQSLFAACYWLVDVVGWRRWTAPLAIYGMNAITVYVLSGVLGDVLTAVHAGGSSLKEILYRDFFRTFAGPKEASLLFAIANVLVLYGVAHLMYRRKWFVRF